MPKSLIRIVPRWAKLGAVAVATCLGIASCSGEFSIEEIRALHAQGRFEETLPPLKAHLDNNPGSAEEAYLYGLALSSLGRPSLAMWPLREAMKSPEWRERATMLLSQNAMIAQNHEGAIELMNGLLEEDPDNEAALLQRSLARLRTRRDYEGGLEDAERLIALNDENFSAHTLRIIALLGLDRVDDAALEFEANTDRLRERDLGFGDDPLSAMWCNIQGTFAKEKNELEAARQIFDDCLEQHPASAPVVRGALEFSDGDEDYERSLEILQGALASSPGTREYRVAVAVRLKELGRADEAKELLREATENPDPGRASHAWADLAGFTFQETGKDTDQVIEFYERALDLSPGPIPQTEFAYAEVLIAAGRLKQALEFSAEMELESHRELVRGRVALESQRPKLALEHLDNGIRLWPDNAVARYLAAIAAERVSDIERAIEEYRYALRIDASATDARVRLARLHLAEGQPEAALRAVRYSRNPGTSAKDLAHSLVEVEVMARLGRPTGNMLEKDMPPYSEAPLAWGKLASRMVVGVRAARGPAAAVKLVETLKQINAQHPSSAPLLRELIKDLAELDQSAEALNFVVSAVAAHPTSAALHVVLGNALRLAAADPEAIRSAFDQALVLKPGSARALAGLAGVARSEGDHERALDLLAQSVAADPEFPEPLRTRAKILIEVGQLAAAEAELELLLGLEPYDDEAALMLAELRARRGAEPTRTRALATAAQRFGAGPRATEFLQQLAEGS
ncbi:MAG: tetratricopeptide repeat protein [Myxococcota bacterium]